MTDGQQEPDQTFTGERLLWVMLWALLAVLLVGAGLFLYWFFGVTSLD